MLDARQWLGDTQMQVAAATAWDMYVRVPWQVETDVSAMLHRSHFHIVTWKQGAVSPQVAVQRVHWCTILYTGIVLLVPHVAVVEPGSLIPCFLAAGHRPRLQ
jgi:hypothetical protein